MIQVTLRNSDGDVIFIGHIPEEKVIIQQGINCSSRCRFRGGWFEDVVTPEITALKEHRG